MSNSPSILIVDDDPGNIDYVSRILKNFETETETAPEEALEKFRMKHHDIIIADQKMPGITGINLIKNCRELHDDFRGIIISAYSDSDDLIDAVNSNIIHKYILKPFTPNILLQHVHRTYETLNLLREKNNLEEKIRQENIKLHAENVRLKSSTAEYWTERLDGLSAAVHELKESIVTYANSESPVMITGETGTGKELAAQALHELSSRRNYPFVKINCTTLAANLVESELFGHEKGAFTGAGQYNPGFFEAAEGGTIFLDEIGDLGIDIQPKLLRILQFGTFFPIGGRKEKHINVRVITATNTNLEEAVKNGFFREDLYHRLNRLRLRIPPLRDRPEDILPIFEKLYRKSSPSGEAPKIDKEALAILKSHQLPGNVRELETYIYRLQLMSSGNRITAGILKKVLEPHDILPPGRYNPQSNLDLKGTIGEMERISIKQALAANNFNITRTAEALGLSRQGLHNKLRKYGIGKGR